MPSSDADSRLLLTMRHGKAESFADTDALRDLAQRGVEQSTMIGEYLQSQSVWPSRVLVSDAARTRQTWDAVLAAMPGFTGEVTFHAELYGAQASQVADLVRSIDSSHSIVMVIGHEPAMSMVTYGLADDESSDAGSMAQARIGLPTGALCVLSSDASRWSDIEENSMCLHTIVRSA